MIKNSIIFMFFIVGCSDTRIIMEPNIVIKNSSNTFVSRAYIDMWGGAAGGINYIVNIQPESEEFLLSKNVIFKTSKEGKICVDWIDETTIKISTSINKGISIKKETIILNNTKINILFTSEINSDNCMKVQGLEAKAVPSNRFTNKK